MLHQAAANPDTTYNVIVLGQPDFSSAALTDHVRKAGGRHIAAFDVIHGIVVDLTGAQLVTVASDPALRSITPNGRVRGQSIASGTLWPLATGVDTLGGTLPRGASAPGIAFVDSGVDSSVAQKDDFGRRIHAVDFTKTPGPPAHDGDGHGTLVAGVAAGASPVYPGVSPTSDIYSLKVVRTDGSAYMGDVIAAVDWIYKNAFRDDIGVASFSLRSSFPNYASYDPLDAAVRSLWLNGVVVTSPGTTATAACSTRPRTTRS